MDCFLHNGSLYCFEYGVVVPLYDEVSLQNVLDVTTDWTTKQRQMLRNKERERKLLSFADLVGKHHGEIVAVVIGTMRSLTSCRLK
ncbi:glutamate--cysteine ligase [Orobanche hederae]